MGLASCKTATNSTKIKADKEIGVNTDLVKYAVQHGDNSTTLHFTDDTFLSVQGTLQDYRAARLVAESEDASCWGK